VIANLIVFTAVHIVQFSFDVASQYNVLEKEPDT